jgi:hypothetical protein
MHVIHSGSKRRQLKKLPFFCERRAMALIWSCPLPLAIMDNILLGKSSAECYYIARDACGDRLHKGIALGF